MKEDIKKMWVEALRSGDYKQASGNLKVAGGHCCLGVLCELYKEDTGNGEWKHSYENHRGEPVFLFADYDGSTTDTVPTVNIIKWAGLGGPNPHLGEDNNGNPISIAERNDGGETFKQIADKIVANF